MLWTSFFTIYWMQIVYQNQLLNVPQWKLTSDALAFLVELSSAACCISVLSKITVGGYRSMTMGIVITFPGNYCVGEGNTINKSIYISFNEVQSILDSIHIIQLPLRWACYSRTKLRNWWLDTHTMMASFDTNDFMSTCPFGQLTKKRTCPT
jgi:hypothetical protein